MTDIISRGRALLALSEPVADGGIETSEPLYEDAHDEGPSETDLLTQLCALTQLMIDRVDALERAMCAPRVRIPVRDVNGKIVSVSDQMIPTLSPSIYDQGDNGN